MILQKQPFLAVLSLAAALLVTPVSAGAGDGAYMTGKALTLFCTSTKPADQFSCQSYIAGIIDYHRLIRSLGTAPSVDFCIPENIKMEQIKTVVVQYIARHTEHQDFIAAPGVTMSLYNVFPCKKPGKKRR